MALSASLFLRQSQTLAMTPQLMQSIQLLQMTHFELNQFIELEVEKNPLLEFAANDDAPTGADRHGKDDLHITRTNAATGTTQRPRHSIRWATYTTARRLRPANG